MSRVLAAGSELETGPIGLVIVLLMLLATFLLIKNMNTRIKRLPPRFPGQDDDPQSGPGSEPSR